MENTNTPPSAKQLYAAMQQMKPLFDKFAKDGEVKITADQIQAMQDIYPSIRVLAHGAIPLTINGGCPSCVQEAFHVFISLFGRLSKDPHVTDEAPATDGIGKADGVLDPNAKKAKDEAKKPAATLTEAEEDELLALLGIERATLDVQDYSTRIDAYIEGLTEPSPALLAKQAALKKAVKALPKPKVKAD